MWSRPSSSRCIPVDDVYVGIFFYELDVAGDLLRFFRDFIRDAPEAYGGFPGFQIAPPLEFIPADRHGDTLAVAIVHWAGPLEEGERAMKPFRELAPVVAEMVAPLPYPALNASFDALFPAGIRSYWKGLYVTELTDAAIEEHLVHGSKVPEVSATMHLYPINGACHRVGAGRDGLRLPGRDLRPGHRGGLAGPGGRRAAHPLGARLPRRAGPALGAGRIRQLHVR